MENHSVTLLCVATGGQAEGLAGTRGGHPPTDDHPGEPVERTDSVEVFAVLIWVTRFPRVARFSMQSIVPLGNQLLQVN